MCDYVQKDMAVIAKIEVNHNRVCDCQRVDVTDSDWHYRPMPDQENVDWAALGRSVAQERVKRGWGKEEAGRQAGVSSITWKRIEDGKRVQDAKLGLVLNTLGLAIDAGGAVVPTRTRETPRPPSGGAAAAQVLRDITERNIAELQAETEQLAAEIAASEPERAARILRDAAAVAVELRQSVERAIASGVSFLPMSAVDDSLGDLVAAHEEEGSISGEQEQPTEP